MGVIVELAHFNPTEAGRVVWDTLYIVPFQIIPNQYGTDRITRDAKIITRGTEIVIGFTVYTQMNAFDSFSLFSDLYFSPFYPP